MYFKRVLFSLVVTAQICSSLKLEPVAQYEGKHSSKCAREQRLTGILVKDKIYTFGGCYPIPYMVDPENDLDLFAIDFDRRFNTSDSVYAYDILNNSWSLESHTPLPMNTARLQVVNNNDIYLVNIHGQPDYYRSQMWKYSTDTKEWRILDPLPFIWRNMLFTCEHDGVIYFAGNHDGDVRNVIQRYDTREEEWKPPLFLDQNLLLNKMVCASNAIQFVGRKAHERYEGDWVSYDFDDPDSSFMNEFSLYASSYENGKTMEKEMNLTIGMFSRVEPSGDWLYILDMLKRNTTLTKINLVTDEKINLGTLEPQKLKTPLFIPYKHEYVYLFGGMDENMGNGNRGGNKDELKTYHHRIGFMESHTAISDEQQTIVKRE